jgi:hypothetical protein
MESQLIYRLTHSLVPKLTELSRLRYLYTNVIKYLSGKGNYAMKAYGGVDV